MLQGMVVVHPKNRWQRCGDSMIAFGCCQRCCRIELLQITLGDLQFSTSIRTLPAAISLARGEMMKIAFGRLQYS